MRKSRKQPSSNRENHHRLKVIRRVAFEHAPLSSVTQTNGVCDSGLSPLHDRVEKIIHSLLFSKQSGTAHRIKRLCVRNYIEMLLF